jgi:ectoine hydroxylase-related dioxygenase (phytanoyl-CoA dioxygenase family)
MQGINTVLTEQEKAAFTPVPGLLKKGEISIHHPFLVHGSFPNRSDKPRRAAVVNYFVTGTVSQTDEPLLAGVEVIPKGSPLVSRFFPVVFRPEWMER